MQNQTPSENTVVSHSSLMIAEQVTMNFHSEEKQNLPKEERESLATITLFLGSTL